MGFARAQVALVNDSLLPADQAQNTWHFITPGAVDASGDDIKDLLTDFYNAAHANILFSSIITGTILIKLYDLEDPQPRPPVYTSSWSLTGTLGAPYPAEVAVCLSYQAPVLAGTPQARRRGRIYLGPISTAAGSSGTGDLRVAVSAREDIADAAAALANQVTYAGLVWVVYSPTIDAGSTLSAACSTVTNGWVDDAFDSQRRRGLAATNRTTWT